MAHSQHDLPALAQHHARKEDEGRPGQAAGDGVDDEALEVHMGKACRQGDESAHHRQHTAEEHGLQAIFVKPVLGNIHMALLHEEILAIFVHEAAAALMSHSIGKDRARYAAYHASRQGSHKGHIPGKNQKSRKAQNQLAGNRNASILSRHQHSHCHIAPVSNELQEYPGKALHISLSSFLTLTLTLRGIIQHYFCFFHEKSKNKKTPSPKGADALILITQR